MAASLSITAPIGGLNARDSLAAMPPQDAVTLDNFFPSPTSVDLRLGSVAQTTGVTHHIESIMPYESSTTGKVFFAAGAAFYDGTVAGAVGAAVVTGLTNARWQSANFGTPGGQFLLNVNGADKLRGFDGTNWWADGDGSHDITGFDTSKAIHINSFKNRVYLVEKSSFRVWYLPVNSIAGTANSLDLSPLFVLGGYLMAMATWTVDNSAGIQQFAIFLSSEGEIAMYQGYDPTTSGSWSLVGMYHVGRPVGRRCFEKVGSDIIVISSDGFMPMSKALLTDRSQLNDALSNKIMNLVAQDTTNYFSNFGWQPILFPLGNKFIINVPQVENDTQYQYVMNTITGAWCRFTNWNANCFGILGNKLYYGGNLVSGAATLFQCDTGYSDVGANIVGEAKPAFQYFGDPGRRKRWTLVRPYFQVAGTLTAAIGLDVDFADNFPTGTPGFTGTAGTAWNTGAWNTFPWGSNSGVQSQWQGVNGEGYCATVHMRIVNNMSATKWLSIEYVYGMGGIL